MTQTLNTKNEGEKIVLKLLNPIQDLLDHPTATNIFIPKYDRIYIDAEGNRQLVPNKLEDEKALLHMVMAVARNTESSFDSRNPFCFSTLPGGQRFTAVHSSIRPSGIAVTIRLFPKQRITLENLQEWNSITPEVNEILQTIISDGSNFMVSGSTNSGKTTLLNAMIQLIPSDSNDHILIAEDTSELSLKDWPLVTQMIVPDVMDKELHRNVERLRLGKLVETSMRLSGDRLIIGEVRYPDAASALYDALNTGSTGVCGTIHANNAMSALKRLANLVTSARNIPHSTIVSDLQEFLDYSIFIERNPLTWHRKVVEIVKLGSDVKQIYKSE